MHGKTVSQAYVLGIGEGRALMRQLVADGLADADTIRSVLANLASQKGLSGDMREAKQGECDYFRRQLVNLERERAA